MARGRDNEISYLNSGSNDFFTFCHFGVSYSWNKPFSWHCNERYLGNHNVAP